MSIFSIAELKIISAQNAKAERLTFTELDHLMSRDPARLTLGLIVKAKGLMADFYSGKSDTMKGDEGLVTRVELDLVIEEYNNLAEKMMLIFTALERRGLITEKELFEIALDMRQGGRKSGAPDSTTGKRRGARGGRKKSAAAAKDVGVDKPVGVRARNRRRVLGTSKTN